MKKEMDKISIIGSGFVGEILGRGLIELGNEVIFYDIVDKELPGFTKDINYAVTNSSMYLVHLCPDTYRRGRIRAIFG
jgi:malate/lactate dehydrogenase